jgi:hypothetical protein
VVDDDHHATSAGGHVMPLSIGRRTLHVMFRLHQADNADRAYQAQQLRRDLERERLSQQDMMFEKFRRTRLM